MTAAPLVHPDTITHPDFVRIPDHLGVVVVHWDNGTDSLHGGFATAAEADAWAERRFGRDRSCESWDVYGPVTGEVAAA